MSDTEQILRKCLAQILDECGYKERNIAIKPFNCGASYFTTILHTATVTSPGKETLHLFTKSAITEDKIRKQLNADILYNTEYRFYTKLVTVFHKLYDKHNVPDKDRLMFPKFYGGSVETGSEIIILEDINIKNYEIIDDKVSVDWEHAAVSIQHLAKFHALGFSMKKENQDIFAEIYEISQAQNAIVSPSLKIIMAESFKHVNEEYRSKVAALMAEEDLMEKLMSESLGSGNNTLIHADYRTSNIMFKNHGNKLLAVPVDYQTMRVGNALVDFLYFIVVNTDEQFRTNYWSQLIECYYTELKNSLCKLKLNINETYPRESFDKDLKTFMPQNIIISMMILPLVAAETFDPSDKSKDPHANDVIHISEIARTRINGVIRDFSRMGVFKEGNSFV